MWFDDFDTDKHPSRRKAGKSAPKRTATKPRPIKSTTATPRAIKTKFIPPYRTFNGKLKSNLTFLCTRCHNAGVYFIKSNATGKVIYIGYSAGNLYKTILRHFQEWKDKKQERFTYSKTGYTVRVILTTTERAALLEKYLIIKLQPRDNAMKYDGYLTATETTKAAKIEKEAPTMEVDDIGEVPF